MGLSSNILWHQSDKDALMSILQSKMFYYAYAMEELPEVGIKVAFPMISLCDIPFSEIGEYLDKYKGYSIGISREWGVKNGFNPVWYCEKGSRISKSLVTGFVDAVKKNKPGSEKITDMRVFSYIKYVEGRLPQHNYENYRFYDEREFRTVYPFENLTSKSLPPVLVGDDAMEDYKKKHSGKKFVYDEDGHIISKSFTWDDVKYIIVKNDSEIHEIKDKLNLLGYTDGNINVFSHQQVLHDLLGVSHSTKSHVVEPVSGDTADNVYVEL